MSATEGREVNNLLRTLRGEQFRHSQNQRRSRTHVSSSISLGRTQSNLPNGIFGPEPDTIEEVLKDPQSAYTTACSGPEAPPSWRLTQMSQKDYQNTVTWRAQALSLIFNHHNTDPEKVPALAMLCLRRLLTFSQTLEDFQEMIEHVPFHLRRDLLRYTAIHAPLNNIRLASLNDVDGHCAGELIIVGPAASFPEDFGLLQSTSASESADVVSPSESWDLDDSGEPSHLAKLILLSVHLPAPTLLSFPATLTHIALINLPILVPIHRLPGLCPLLVSLDLSYNSWLHPTAASDTGIKLLEKMDWGRWTELKTLGLRGCALSQTMLTKVSKGRWGQLNIVFA
ncbi:hypothetical protein C8J56DRAFT_260549 [Mycena floridula]|nr:hypothetical protein C8J56DRAFT_260549 [Mycena floridula]